ALLAVVGRGRSGGALDLDDVHRRRGGLVGVQRPLTDLGALLDEVRAEERLVERRVLAVHRAIGKDHRDMRVLSLLQHGIPAGLTDSSVTALSAINANLLSTAPSLEWGSQLLAPGGVVSVNILLRRQQGRAIGRSTWCVCGLLLGACPRW